MKNTETPTPIDLAVKEKPQQTSTVDRSTPLLEPGYSTEALKAPSKPFPYVMRWVTNAIMMVVGSSAALAISLSLAGMIRWMIKGEAMIPDLAWAAIIIWPVASIIFRLVPGWGLGAVEEVRRTILLWAGLFGTTALVLFFSKTGADFSRLTLSIAFTLALPALLIARIQVKRILIRAGIWGLPTVVYGAGHTGEKVVEILRKERGLGFAPIGFFEDKPEAPALNGKQGHQLLGRSDSYTDQAPVAILAMPGVASERIAELLEGPLSIYRKVIIIPDLFDAPSLWVKPRDLLGVIGLEVSSNLSNPIARIIKRSSDWFITLAFSPIWIPLCVIIAGLIWLEDRKNPFFTQIRLGLGKKAFPMFKFRTMLVDADKVLKDRLEEDPELKAEWEEEKKLKNDPRVTKLGTFLRRTSLDELPQLINVLRGEISLVGPRPLPKYHYRDLSGRARRLREQVRPGITGLWQVSGRSDLGTSGMERWDPYYVRNWSIWLDVVILVRTVRAVIRKQGAR